MTNPLDRNRHSTQSARDLDYEIARGIWNLHPKRLLGKAALGVAAITTFVAVTGIGSNETNGDESSTHVACSGKTTIDLGKLSNRSINGEHFDASMVQVNNAIATALDHAMLFSNPSELEREALAEDLEPRIAALDDSSTPEIETGNVCIAISKDGGLAVSSIATKD